MSEILVRACEEYSHSECGLRLVLQGTLAFCCYRLFYINILHYSVYKFIEKTKSNHIILVTFIMQYILNSSVTEPQLYPETIKQISELQCYTLWHTGMSHNHIKHTAVHFNSICCHINSKCAFIH